MEKNERMNILETIIEHKKSEIRNKKSEIPISDLERDGLFNRKTLSLKKFLLDESRTGIIAEFKRKSPSKGVIHHNADVVGITKAYSENGASALSVLTDENFFGGSKDEFLRPRLGFP